MTALNVVSSIRPGPSLADAPGQLRQLADILDKDVADKEQLLGFGNVKLRVSIVVRISGEEPRVYSHGDAEGSAQTFMDLHAGAAQLMAMVHPERAS